jgi:hypothetical protein
MLSAAHALSFCCYALSPSLKNNLSHFSLPPGHANPAMRYERGKGKKERKNKSGEKREAVKRTRTQFLSMINDC